MGKPHLPNVKVTFWPTGTFNVDGNGASSISLLWTPLFAVDSTNKDASGYTWNLSPITVTAPLVLQGDGSYKANASLLSNTLQATYNSSTSTVTTCVEGFTMGDMQGVP